MPSDYHPTDSAFPPIKFLFLVRSYLHKIRPLVLRFGFLLLLHTRTASRADDLDCGGGSGVFIFGGGFSADIGVGGGLLSVEHGGVGPEIELIGFMVLFVEEDDGLGGEVVDAGLCCSLGDEKVTSLRGTWW